MTKVDQQSVKSYPLGLNKGYKVTKICNKDRPMNKKGKTSNRVREIRDVIQSVTQLSSFEKRVVELFKTGVQKVQKRAFKLLKKRMGTRKRAIKKQKVLSNVIKLIQNKNVVDKKKQQKKKKEKKKDQ